MHGSSAAPQLPVLCILPVQVIFKKHFLLFYLCYFQVVYLVATIGNSVTGEITGWIPTVDCGSQMNPESLNWVCPIHIVLCLLTALVCCMCSP